MIKESKQTVYIKYFTYFVSIGAQCWRGRFWTIRNYENNLHVVQNIQRYSIVTILHKIKYKYIITYYTVVCNNIFIFVWVTLSVVTTVALLHCSHTLQEHDAFEFCVCGCQTADPVHNKNSTRTVRTVPHVKKRVSHRCDSCCNQNAFTQECLWKCTNKYVCVCA